MDTYSSSAQKISAIPPSRPPWLFLGHYLSCVLVLVAVALLFYGLAWNFSTRRYLRGFADAIVPLDGTPEEKSEAILAWLRHEPRRRITPEATGIPRDPVFILQNAQLLKVCGSATNAFINLAESAGLKTRRLLLLDQTGGARHVVAEVRWGKRWVVVDPSLGRVFEDDLGRALSKEDLHQPRIFADAISRMPGYRPTYSFDRTTHIRLERIPMLGALLRRVLNRVFPAWEDAFYWAYIVENPSSWPILASVPFFLAGISIFWFMNRCRGRYELESLGIRNRLMNTGRALLYRSA